MRLSDQHDAYCAAVAAALRDAGFAPGDPVLGGALVSMGVTCLMRTRSLELVREVVEEVMARSTTNEAAIRKLIGGPVRT